MPNLPSERRAAQLTRDAALRRVVRARTGLIVGSAGLTAGLAVFVADTAPGKTYNRGHAVRAAVIRQAALPPLATPRELGLHPDNGSSNTSTQAGSTATATQPTPTAAQPTPTATQPAPSPPVAVASAPAPVVSGGS